MTEEENALVHEIKDQIKSIEQMLAHKEQQRRAWQALAESRAKRNTALLEQLNQHNDILQKVATDIEAEANAKAFAYFWLPAMRHELENYEKLFYPNAPQPKEQL